MGIQEVQNQSGTPAYQKRKKTESAEGFQESFLQNLKSRDREKQAITEPDTEAKKAAADMQMDTQVKAEQVVMGGIGAATGIRVSAAAAQKALQAVEVRHISCEDSDNVRIAVTEGYMLKGKLLRNADTSEQKNKNAVNGSGEKDSGKTDAAQVYVEAKYEDGRLEAYQVDTTKVFPETEHAIERFALETLENA